MPYAPTVNDRSGEILGNAGTNAAQIRAQGSVAAAQSVADAIINISNMYMKKQEKSEQNKMTSDYLDSMAGQFSKTPGADGVTPMMSADDLEKFSKSSLGAKQGMIAPLQAQYEQSLKNQYLAAQIEGFGQRQGYQYQVPANQQPMAPLGTNSSANNAVPQTQSIFSNPNIRTADQFGQ
jgi:hypothetical protein